MSPSRFLNFLIPGLNLVLTFVVGLTLAYWLWTLWALGASTPIPDSAGSPALTANTSGIAVRLAGTHFFGQPENPANSAIAPSRQNLRLSGTLGGSRGRPSQAIIAADGGKPAAYAEGSEIAAGVVVHQVRADHVLLKRNGAIEQLELDRKAGAANLIQPARTPR